MVGAGKARIDSPILFSYRHKGRYHKIGKKCLCLFLCDKVELVYKCKRKATKEVKFNGN